jgi:hypothetical protein
MSRSEIEPELVWPCMRPEVNLANTVKDIVRNTAV